jgi:flagellar biosynthesis protein FliR
MPSVLLNPSVWAFTEIKVLVWLLSMVRMTGLLATMPGFGSTRVPLVLRAALVVLLSLVIAPVVPLPKATPSSSSWIR